MLHECDLLEPKVAFLVPTSEVPLNPHVRLWRRLSATLGHPRYPFFAPSSLLVTALPKPISLPRSKPKCAPPLPQTVLVSRRFLHVLNVQVQMERSIAMLLSFERMGHGKVSS